MAPEAVAALFKIDLAAELADTVRFKEDETPGDLSAAGAALVAMYAAANQDIAVKGAEVPFELEIVPGILLRGVFDVLVDNGRIRELKTAARDYDEGTLARLVQVSAYAWAYRKLYDHDAVIEVVAMLKQRQPRIAMHEITRSPQEQAWFVGLTVEVARAIAAGVYPPNPSWACGDCEYGQQCRSIGGGR